METVCCLCIHADANVIPGVGRARELFGIARVVGKRVWQLLVKERVLWSSHRHFPTIQLFGHCICDLQQMLQTPQSSQRVHAEPLHTSHNYIKWIASGLVKCQQDCLEGWKRGDVVRVAGMRTLHRTA